MGVSLPKEVVLRIDTERGDIPRSRYILRKLEEIYNQSSTTAAALGTGLTIGKRPPMGRGDDEAK
jgi:hypothetical protein